MSSLTSPAGAIHLGMDTSKNTIVVAVLMPGEEVPVVDRMWNEEGSVRHLVGRFPDRAALRACYEAGPCGFELHRLLTSMGVACDVVAPALIPKGTRDRVKTDKRDAIRLARLHRAGELTPIRVPSPAEEAVRDLVRVRHALLADCKRGRQRITAMLMRHGRIWRAGPAWTQAHEQWIAAQCFDEPTLASAPAHYRAALDTRLAELAAVESELASWAGRTPLGPAVARLGCYRGIAELNGLTLAAEVVDWRRFPTARVHGLHRAGPVGVLERRARPPRRDHQGRLRAGPHRTDRGRLGLPAQAGHRRQAAPPPARRQPRDPRPVLEGAAPPARQVPGHDRPRQARAPRGHRARPRAGRVRLGRDDQLRNQPP